MVMVSYFNCVRQYYRVVYPERMNRYSRWKRDHGWDRLGCWIMTSKLNRVGQE